MTLAANESTHFIPFQKIAAYTVKLLSQSGEALQGLYSRQDSRQEKLQDPGARKPIPLKYK